jgi:hypothetical protein
MAEDDVADALSQLSGGASPPARPAATPARPARPTQPPPPPVARPASPTSAVPSPNPAPRAARPASPRPEAPRQPAPPVDDDELVAAEIDVDDESGEPVGEAANPLANLQQSTPPAAARLRRPAKKGGGLKATMAPILLTVGTLLLFPAVWATLLLAGVEVPLTDRDNAHTMAKVMLSAWPLSVILITAGVVAIVQVTRESRGR